MSRHLAFLLAMLVLAGCATTSPGRVPAGQPGATAPAPADAGRGLSAAGEALLIQGANARRSGDYGAASATLERALRIEPSAPAVWLELARVRLQEGKLAQAEQLARKARSLAGDDVAIAGQAESIISEAGRQLPRD